jgi:Dolichyl-phosphate-mannose-protein mannosyltransferase
MQSCELVSDPATVVQDVPAVVPHQTRPSYPWLTMMLAAVLMTSLYVHQSLAAGRLACGIPLYDDVGYFEDALKRLQMFYRHGPGELFYEHWRHPPHAPWSTYAALLGYLLFGNNLWAPYAINAVLVFLSLALINYMFRRQPLAVRAALSVLFLSMPYATALVLECRPDALCAMLTAFGLWLLASTPLEGMRRTQALGIGAVWGATMWVKPTVFAQSALFLLAGMGWGWLSALRLRPRPSQALLRNSALCILTAGVVAAPHMLPNLTMYLHYMRHHLFGSGRDFAVMRGDFNEHFQFYTLGQGGEFMFGGTFLILLSVLAVTLAIAVWRGRSGLCRQLLALTTFCLMCWLLPTLNAVKTPFLGMAFGCLLLFTVLRCLAAWLDGELGVAPQWSMPAGLCTVALLCSFWSLPYCGPANDPQNRQYAEAIEGVYQALRTHLSRGPRTQVVLTTVGNLNATVLRWRFLMDQAKTPKVLDVGFSRTLDDYVPWLDNTDVFVIPEPGMKSLLVYESFPSASLQEGLLQRFVEETRYRQFGAVSTPSGKRILLFERRQPLASRSQSNGS